jgi:LacI family transcriptional regulator
MPRVAKRKAIRAATLADVGREAGVSAMAASAVLNGARTSSRISQDTRERILAAATKLRYRPNAAARALAERRMNTIGVAALFDESGDLNHYFLEVFNGVLEAAAHNNQNTTVFTLHDWEQDFGRLNGFCDGRIDGLILVGPIISKETAKHLPEHTPFVALHANIPLPGVLNIESDEETGAYEIVRHLITNGHRRILHLAGQSGLLGAERRLAGYRRALASAHIPFDPSLVVEAGFSASVGRIAVAQWLKTHRDQPLPDAIFCASDPMAVGCLEALSEVGIRVPEDISVTGFDDSLAARTTMPQLTTVRQPLRAMGIKAVEALLVRIQQHLGHADVTEPKPLVFPVELVVRASVRKRRGK